MNLRCENITVSFEHKEILHSVSLEVKERQLVSLLGPSGCGKSTLLKTIAGLITPDRGDVIIGGKSVTKLPPYKRGTVIVFQDLRLFPNLNLEDNVAFPLKMQGIDKKARLFIANEFLEKVQLDGLSKRKINQISGGQMQRTALARALAANPKILLLDEPFSSLDENLRQDMRSLLVRLQKELGMTTVLVTHDPREALMISDKIAVMFSGEIVQYDTTRSLYNSPTNKGVADYFGDANYIDGRVVNGVFESTIVSFAVAMTDGAYKAMFRPTAVILSSDQGDYELMEIDYMGEHCKITLQYHDIKLLLSVVTNDSLQLGSMVSIVFDTSKAILFKN